MQPEDEQALTRLRGEFSHPQPDSRPVIFWLWNGDLEEARLKAQLEDIHAQGFGGVVLHPMGENFRLGDFLCGISPPYLSEQFFGFVRFTVQQAASLGMKVWLYDEGGWPSGSAQGLVVDGHPELRARTLTCRRLQDVSDVVDTEACVARVAVGPGGILVLAPGQGKPPSDTEYLLLFEEKVYDGFYPDLLQPEATERFLELTHERYADAVGEYFGTTIPGLFTDEPRVLGTIGGAEAPWSPALRQRMERLSDRWQAWLPALFGREALGFDPFEKLGEALVVEARCQYCDALAAQFREAYFSRLNAWCQEHGLVHAGHVGGEDNLADHVNGGFFHWFRTAGALHAPGIDVIWRQIAPRGGNPAFVMLPASALHTRPAGAGPSAEPGQRLQRMAVSESFAVYGYGATFELYRWVSNLQFLEGINYLWPMAYYYATDEGRVYGTMSHLGPGNPLWRHWKGFAEYLARLSAVVAHTGHACDTALYYPIEAEWAYHGSEHAAQAWASFSAAYRALQGAQVPFDLLDADALASAKVGEGFLETPGQIYSTIIIPDCRVLPLDVLRKLRELYEAGGRVVFLGQLPKWATRRSDQEAFENTLRTLEEEALYLDARSEREQWGGFVGRGSEAGPGSVLDGLSAALLGPVEEAFAPSRFAPKAVLVASDEEIVRVGRLLAYAGTRYVVEPVSNYPDLHLSSRWLNQDTWLHLIFNSRAHSLQARLALVSDSPLVVEKWDPGTGRTRIVRRHEDVAEATYFKMALAPGELVLLVTRPLDDEDAFVPEDTGRRLELFVARQAEQAFVVSRVELQEGTLRVVEDREPLPASALGSWEALGLHDFSGTVRYHFALPVAEEYLSGPVVLELGEVQYAASVYINGVHAGELLWPPYRLPIEGLLRAGHNELVVEVSNTLAPQVLRQENIEEARARGWDNAYYRRTLQWHQESLAGGLLGPVRLWAETS